MDPPDQGLDMEARSVKLSAVNPPRGPTSGGVLLQIDGQGFSVGATVIIAGLPATQVSVVSPTRITAILPAHPGAFGLVPVEIRNRDGGRAIRDDLFSYYASQLVFPGPEFPVGQSPVGIATGDLNGDGRLDIVTANRSSGTVSVLIGNGGGHFAAQRDFSVDGFLNDVAIADLDEDRKQDLIVAGRDSVSVLRGDGSGGFAAPRKDSTLSVSSQLVMNDLNGDKHIDAVVLNPTQVSVLLGDGRGALAAPRSFPVSTDGSALAAADWNGDGQLDLATQNSASINVLLGDGSGGFGAAISSASGAYDGTLAAGDLDGDKRPDLVVLDRDGKRLRVLRGDGTGRFTTAKTLTTDYRAAPVAAVLDVDRDGNQDVMVATNGALHLLLGDGSGGLTAGGNFAAGRAPVRLASGDFDGDGKLDIAMTNSDSDTVALLTGGFLDGRGAARQIAPGSLPIAADFNQDGQADLAILDNAALTIRIRLSDGAGKFRSAPDLPLSVSAWHTALACDCNEDKNPDLIVPQSDYLSLYAGDGKGGFAPRKDVKLAFYADYLALGDLNADGHLDLVASGERSSTAQALLGDGAGNFAGSMLLPLSDMGAGVALADLNRDGKLDLVVSTSTSLETFIGDGRGKFTAAGNLMPPSGRPTQLWAADFDGDQNPDLVLRSPSSDSVYLLPGDGMGGLGAAKQFVTAGEVDALSISDLDGDGRMDLIAANFKNEVSVLLGDGAGAFASPRRFCAGFVPRAIAAGDFDGDQRLDLAIGGGAVSILLNLSK